MRYLALVLRSKLINNLMKLGSTIFRLTLCGYLFTHITKSHGKGRWRCDARRSYWGLCKSFTVTGTVDTTTCDTQFRSPVYRIFNSYLKRLVFKSLYEDRLILLIVLWLYWVVLYQYHDSFSKQVSTVFIHIFPTCFYTTAQLLRESLYTHIHLHIQTHTYTHTRKPKHKFYYNNQMHNLIQTLSKSPTHFSTNVQTNLIFNSIPVKINF